MRLIVGAPVANRAWSVPLWMASLAAQTRRPDGFVFVHSGIPRDDTWQALVNEARRHGFPPPSFLHDPATPHRREDNARFDTLARLRNDLLDLARYEQADMFLSLDTDVMLEDPDTIERLVSLVRAGDCDIAAPVTFLHPLAARHWTPGEPVSHAYSFAFMNPGQPSHRRPWSRPYPADLPWGELIRMQVPMAAWLGNTRALNCHYGSHESGEDVAFAQSLETAGLECIADTSLYGWHVWSERHLPGGPEHIDHREQELAA